MSDFTGFVNAGLQLGLESILIKPARGIYGIVSADGAILPDIIANATIEEVHHDDLEITDHPVEQGASITDHAFKRPAEVVLKLGWSNSPVGSSSMVNAAIGYGAANSTAIRSVANVVEIEQAGVSLLGGAEPDQLIDTYQKLLQLQISRALFVIYTGKRVYTNMLCKSLATQTDAKTANVLFVTMTCRQVILVNTETVSLTKDTQKVPEATASIVPKGDKQLLST